MEPICLSAVENFIAFGVVTHKHLAKGRLEFLNVGCEIVPVLKVEFLLPALLRWTSIMVALRSSVAKNRRSKLLIDEDRRLFFWDAAP